MLSRKIRFPYCNSRNLSEEGEGGKREGGRRENQAGYTATPVACGWAEAALEKVTRAFGQEQLAQKAQKRRKSKRGTTRRTDGQTQHATKKQGERGVQIGLWQHISQRIALLRWSEEASSLLFISHFFFPYLPQRPNFSQSSERKGEQKKKKKKKKMEKKLFQFVLKIVISSRKEE